MNAQSKTNSKGFSRVDTLIITVGTRQVGWRCPDGVVRCLGADGDRGAPSHIDELYTELNIERGYHLENDPNSRWGVRNLGEHYYKSCETNKDFSQVELLLDDKIIADGIHQGLKHIILWGTNQPNSISWSFRRADTIWLARLMAGKIQHKWANVKVDVWPDIKNGNEIQKVLAANNNEEICLELENHLLPYVLNSVSHKTANDFILSIQNKGATPAIANGLEICAAALVRQYRVLNVSPIEPVPLYERQPNGSLSVRNSENYQTISIGDYFWPLERMRVISAWKRGDFREAEIWLTSHQTRFEGVLYKLAGCLALSTNWQIHTFLHDKNKGIENWLRSQAVARIAQQQQIQTWKQLLNHLRTHKPAQAWESTFLVDLSLLRGNYTSAFMQFSQTLERLLYIKFQNNSNSPNSYQPDFKQLIDDWFDATKREKKGSVYNLFYSIRKLRNAIVHNAEAVTIGEIISVWANNGWSINVTNNTQEVAVMKRMIETLQMVCEQNWDIREQTLLQSLYQWGLNCLSPYS